MNNTDSLALKGITRDGLIWVNGMGHEVRKDNESLPTKRLYCNNCKDNLLFAIAKVYLWASRKPGVVVRCHKCGKFNVIPAYSFEDKPKLRFNFGTPIEQKERINKEILRMKGYDEEDIKEIASIQKDEWAKEAILEQKQLAREKAERAYELEEMQRKEKSKNFKERLDAGEIVFVKKERAFVEVSTGNIVRKL